MPDQTLVDSCAPTLAGLKTASLINVRYADKESANDDVRRMNRLFAKKGLRVVPLKYCDGRVLLYVYRPALLKKDMEDKTARAMLDEMGYSFEHADAGVAQLAKRMNTSKEFPHEIGLFLGYPPEDVHGFIHHKYEGCTHVGDWRVYGDADAAREKFARYKKCRDAYRSLYQRGKSVESLTVKTA